MTNACAVKINKGISSMFAFLIPDDTVLMSIGAAFGAVCCFLFGEVRILLIWLTIFVICDFFTGTWAAIVTGKWSSHANFVGVTKKVFVFVMVALGHGLDVVFLPILHFEIIESIIICAYAAGEFGSIIENLERGGLQGVVPPVVRRLLAALNAAVDKSVDRVAGKEENK